MPHGLIAYEHAATGHRTSYLTLFEKTLGAKPMIGGLPKRWRECLKPDKILFSTCDDYFAAFFVIAILRAIKHKPTVGLTLRSEQTFLNPNLKRWLKGLLLKILMRVPHVRLVTIIPHWADERAAKVTHDWIYDLQLWDLPYLFPQLPVESSLCEKLRQTARGRKIVLAPGHQSRYKGIDFFCDLYAKQPALRERYLFAGIGPNSDVPQDKINAFEKAGGYWNNTLLSEEDLLSLYPAADLVWCCYHPDYDHSSGIFGRALQLGKPTLTREGSILEKLQSKLTPPPFSIPFGDAEGAARRLMATSVAPNRAPVFENDAPRKLLRILGLDGVMH